MEYKCIFQNEKDGTITLSVCFNKKELLSMGIDGDAVDFNPLYLGCTELTKLQRLWKDPIYLGDFYGRYLSYLKDPFWKNIKEEEFVKGVANQSLSLFEKVQQLLKNGSLKEMFVSLDKKNDVDRKRNKTYKVKAKYGNLKGRLIFRLYGVVLSDNTICITGGALKVVKDMDKAPNTDLELKKMERVRRDLDENCVFDKESFIDFIVE